jgi:cell division transport system ATP-binding protein
MLVEYKNATIYQQDGNEVLKNVNFHVDEGEFVYLIGRVGSGKSSLLKSVYFELEINEADEATVLGADLKALRRKHIPALRRQMGIIFQDFQLLADRTVYKNLRFVLRATGWKKSEVDDRINEVLAQVGMTDKKMNMPHELSGGEQQRIAIARALLNSPKMIIADEPTGNLDPESAQDIMQILRQIAQTGTAVIMSTHNMPLLNDYPGIVYRCANGEVKEVTNDFNKMQISEEADEANEGFDILPDESESPTYGEI